MFNATEEFEVHLNKTWMVYTYIHQTPMLVLYLTFGHNDPSPGVGSKTDIWLVYNRPTLIYASENLPPEHQHDILSCQS
jgi:hypothetical protein